MPAPTWTIAYNGTTKSAAAWGVKGMTLTQESKKPGMVKFTTPGVAVDATPTFQQASNVVLTITAAAAVGGATHFTIYNHLYFTGLGCRLSAPASGSALPAGVAGGTVYYLRVIDQNTIALAPTQADAIAGTSLILCGSAGTMPLCIRVLSQMTIYENGVPWFVGWVTKIPGKATPNSESQEYEVQDVIWFFQKTIFQQMSVYTDNPEGEVVDTITTTTSSVIMSQSLSDGTKMDLSQVFNEVMMYMVYALAGVPFPTTVDETTLGPTSLADPYALFQIGSLPPDLTILYSQLKDKMCAEILTLLLRNLPDCVWWCDYTTAPVTMNFGARSSLPAKTIAVVSGAPSSGFSATRRDDLLVPGVILKYSSPITIDGNSTVVLTVDKYPAQVADNTPGVLINTIDLTGGHATYQKQEVTVRARPVTGLESLAIGWLLKHNDDLKALDYANMVCTGATTTVNTDDPAAALLPVVDGMIDSNGLSGELLTGAITDWMKANDGLMAIDAVILLKVSYTGEDLNTLAFFTDQPSPGTALIPVKCKITNAQTQTYQELTSFQQPETPPTGLAEYIFGVLSALHFEGTLELTNPEATNPLPVGCVFNTTDGNAQWQAMNALVLRVEINCDEGKTKITFGPTVSLDANDLVDLIRAQSAPLVSWQLNQRTTGSAGQENAVIGHAHSAASSSTAPPPIKMHDFKVLIRPTPVAAGSPPDGTWQRKIYINSTLLRTVDASDNQAITGLDSWDNFDNGNDLQYLEVTLGLDGYPTGANITSWGLGGSWDPNDGPQPSGTGSGWFEYDTDVDDSGNTIYTVTLVRYPIHSSVTNADGTISNVQKLALPLLMEGDTYNGNGEDGSIIASYYKPVPYTGPSIEDM